MRAIIILLGVFIISAAVAQENDELLSEPESKKRGAFGGAVIKMTTLADEFGLMLGGRGGWIVNRNLTLGGGIYGSLMGIDTVADDQFQGEFEFGYGGVEAEYVAFPSAPVHFSLQALVGVGGLTNQIRPLDRRVDDPEDTLLIFEPGFNLIWNVASYFHMALGISYRFILGVNTEGLENTDLKGSSAVLTAGFGQF